MAHQVVIVGGGISGVLAGRTLLDHGVEVLIIEKARSVGGRMATRRIDEGKVDHGAQFFTVRTKLFQSYIDKWQSYGWVSHWFGEEYHRYKAIGGMNQLVKNLATNIPTKLNTKVVAIKQVEQQYLLNTEMNEQIKAKAVIITAPAPQAISLIEELKIERSAKQQLEKIKFNPCFVLIVVLDRPSLIPDPGHLSEVLPEGIERIVDHHKKGISGKVTLSVYSTGAWALAHSHLMEDEIIERLLEKTKEFVDRNSIIKKQLKKWRYSEAVTTHHGPFLDLQQELPLLICGDAFLLEDDPSNRTRIESAFNSGVAVANEMMKRFS
jgi:renalase